MTPQGLSHLLRNCIVNVGETVVYDAAKDYFISAGLLNDGIKCHLARYNYLINLDIPTQGIYFYKESIYN